MKSPRQRHITVENDGVLPNFPTVRSPFNRIKKFATEVTSCRGKYMHESLLSACSRLLALVDLGVALLLMGRDDHFSMKSVRLA